MLPHWARIFIFINTNGKMVTMKKICKTNKTKRNNFLYFFFVVFRSRVFIYLNGFYAIGRVNVWYCDNMPNRSLFASVRVAWNVIQMRARVAIIGGIKILRDRGHRYDDKDVTKRMFKVFWCCRYEAGFWYDKHEIRHEKRMGQIHTFWMAWAGPCLCVCVCLWNARKLINCFKIT